MGIGASPVPIVSVINYKGGVGKTTIVANLAAELAWRENSVLLIDLDPQASLTFSFLTVDSWRQNYAGTTTIRNWYDAFIDQDQDIELSNLIITPDEVNRYMKGETKGEIDLICSHLSLINVDLELATMLAGASLRQSRNNFLKVHSRLLDGLNAVGVEDRYDYVLIDCPPNFNIVTKTAIVASSRILIPAIPDYLSTLGIEQLQRHIAELTNDFNEYAQQAEIAPSIIGVIPTMVQVYGGEPINAQRPYIDSIRRTGTPVFDTFIRRNNTLFGDSPQYGIPVVIQGVSGPTQTTIQTELENLTTEFVQRL